MTEPPLIASLRRALEAAPDDVPLRLHLAEQLLAHERFADAVREAAAVLAIDPGSTEALAIMNRAAGDPGGDAQAAVPRTEFDWSQAESELEGAVPPMYVDGGPEPDASAYDVERSSVSFADVGGMEEVKARLDAAFLTPLRNPELRAMYAKSLRGGLLLYGPPGCGKTFLARAVAGEMGAGFISVSIVDVLDMWLGTSERNLHEIFQLARRSAPCVVFLDELDALGQKRSQLKTSAGRTTVNQLLQELDGVGSENEGVFVLAATNQPWDIDAALRRPGRLDRMVLVLPPDEPARSAIVKTHLQGRPISSIDLGWIAARTAGFSGADLAHLCETAAEKALMDSVRTGTARTIEMRDFESSLPEIKPSTGAWFESARNVATFANADGEYDGILDYLKRHRRR
ncbi:MAG TPA: AAA family ATPase [Nocardioidaceae bacterium]|nr:AAA family ATPase [Nocardioidaceae bacterium]